MKKRRRIEITAFRRRTAIVLRDRPEVEPTWRPHPDGETSHPVRADPARAVEIDLDQTQITALDDAQFGLNQAWQTNGRKST